MVLPADLHSTQLVLREARYYQLTGLIQLLDSQAKCFEHDFEAASAAVSAGLLLRKWH
jgi:hypothetical protein